MDPSENRGLKILDLVDVLRIHSNFRYNLPTQPMNNEASHRAARLAHLRQSKI